MDTAYNKLTRQSTELSSPCEPLSAFFDASKIEDILLALKYGIDEEVSMLVSMIRNNAEEDPKMALAALRQLNDLRTKAVGQIEAKHVIRNKDGSRSSFSAHMLGKHLPRSKMVENITGSELSDMDESVSPSVKKIAAKIQEIGRNINVEETPKEERDSERTGHTDKPTPRAIHDRPPEEHSGGGLSSGYRRI